MIRAHWWILLLPTVLMGRQPFSFEDYWALRFVSDAQISSDGSQVAYVVGWNDRTRDARFANIWVAAGNGQAARQFTEGDWMDRSPRWSPDGSRLAWISTRDGKQRIWVRSLNKDDGRVLTAGDAVPSALAWSPDGRSIAFTARVAAANARPSWAPAELVPYLWPKPAGTAQVFIVPAAGGEAMRLTQADLNFTGEPAWLPDGLAVLCAASGQIFSIRIADRALRELTREGGIHEQPAPSPDGGKIAFVARAKPDGYSLRNLFVMNADGSRLRALAGALGRDAMHPQWSNDSRTVYFTADDSGATHVYAARNDGSFRQVTKRAERLRRFSLAANGRAATVRDSATEAGAVITFAVDLPAGVATAASPNEHLLAEREVAPAEEIAYPSAGKQIQAWLIKPPGFDAAKKYPLILTLRDAPRRMWGPEFDLETQVLAAAGNIVLCANPRGTPGYGEEFGNLLASGDPRDAAEDLRHGIEFAIGKEFVGGKRVAAIGGPDATWLMGHSAPVSRVVLRRMSAQAAAQAAEWLDGTHAAVLVLAREGDAGGAEMSALLQQRKIHTGTVRVNGAAASAWVMELRAMLGWLAE